jgi:hypothetical protein
MQSDRSTFLSPKSWLPLRLQLLGEFALLFLIGGQFQFEKHELFQE